VQTLVVFILVAALVACSKPPQAEPTETQRATGLESIPAADPAKYPPFSNMSGWKNPYLIVRDDGIGFLDLANREIHLLKPEEVEAELVALPSSAWPYGRVVFVAEAVPKAPSEQTKADVRKNRALLLGTLKELDVQYREAP
jgi:streptogramin lyase